MNDLITTDLDQTLVNIKNYLGHPADLVTQILSGKNATLIIYLEALVNEDQLFGKIQEFINLPSLTGINPLPQDTRDPKSVLEDLAQGHAIFLEIRNDHVFVYNLPVPGWQKRPIEEPVSEQLIRGPREGFTETISVNTAMIRRWINDRNLRVRESQVGVRTKTKVRLIYLEDIADPSLVREVEKRINAIEIDGVLESGYLEQLITDNRLTVFPLIQSTERSDKVAAAVLEGRVAILVDKSPFTLIVPTTVNELYQTPEDYYFGFYLGSFLRFFRLLGNNLAVALSGLYIALTSFNPELLPTDFAFSIAESRRGIPYPVSVEVLFLEIMVEIFREAGLRLPRNVNQVLGIVAGIALAFAAVDTRLVSGTTLVVVAIGAIASFSGPSFSVGIPWRIFKFFLIFGAATFGIVGLTLAGILILAHAATLTSFGTSYLAPWAPIRAYELGDSLFRMPLWLRLRRPAYYRPSDKNRMKVPQHKGSKNDD